MQRLMFILFFFNFVTNFYCFPTTYCSNLAMSLCVKYIPISYEYIALQIALHLSLKYFDCKFYIVGVELKHECSFYFFYHWYSMFYAEHYHFVFYNEQQMYLATLWSALIFYSINLLNIVQFVVRMWSNKNHKIRHSRKKICGLEGFSLNPWIFNYFIHNGYCFYFSPELLKFPDNLINLGWFSHVLGHHIFQPFA